MDLEEVAVYQLGNTSSRMITEGKQCQARLVLGWETPVQVMSEYFFKTSGTARFD